MMSKERGERPFASLCDAYWANPAALDKVEDITIEKLIDVDMMVRIQMFRLSKRECAAVGAREAIDSRFGRPWNKDRNELDGERFGLSTEEQW